VADGVELGLQRGRRVAGLATTSSSSPSAPAARQGPGISAAERRSARIVLVVFLAISSSLLPRRSISTLSLLTFTLPSIRPLTLAISSKSVLRRRGGGGGRGRLFTARRVNTATAADP